MFEWSKTIKSLFGGLDNSKNSGWGIILLQIYKIPSFKTKLKVVSSGYSCKYMSYRWSINNVGSGVTTQASYVSMNYIPCAKVSASSIHGWWEWMNELYL